MDDGKATEKETASAMAAIATVLDALTEIPSVEFPDGPDEGETEVLQWNAMYGLRAACGR